MTLNITTPEKETELKPRIVVIGIGGAGGNAVNNMIQSNLEGVDFVTCNTDAQALNQSKADKRIQLGVEITQGLGAGARPDVGRAAAEESQNEIMAHLEGANMVFITAGMGGGTGTGAAPVIAELAREKNILTVGVVTKPFQFEGNKRMVSADDGIKELQKYVDTLIIIPNQNLFRIANEKTTFADAFKMADNVLHSGVRGVTDLMVMPGLINLDFADIRTVMSEMGKAMMGTGEAEGDNRAIMAAEAAISNPLLDDVTMRGARGVLINITGGMDMTLFEVDEAANRIREEVDKEANIIFGSTFDENLNGAIRVSVVATGIEITHGENSIGNKRNPIEQAPKREAQPISAIKTEAVIAAKPEEIFETSEIAQTDQNDESSKENDFLDSPEPMSSPVTNENYTSDDNTNPDMPSFDFAEKRAFVVAEPNPEVTPNAADEAAPDQIDHDEDLTLSDPVPIIPKDAFIPQKPAIVDKVAFEDTGISLEDKPDDGATNPEVTSNKAESKKQTRRIKKSVF